MILTWNTGSNGDQKKGFTWVHPDTVTRPPSADSAASSAVLGVSSSIHLYSRDLCTGPAHSQMFSRLLLKSTVSIFLYNQGFQHADS